MAAMRRWLAWCLCACACFSETDTGGSGDHGDETSSSTGSTGPSTSNATTASTTQATSVTTTDSTTTMTEVTSDDLDTSASETTADGCDQGVALPPHEGWMGPVAIGTGMGMPGTVCPGGMEPVAWGLGGGATPSCSCHCQGGPSVLCNLAMTFGQFGCAASGVMLDDCNNVGMSEHLQANVSGATCNPDLAVLEIPDSAPNVFACPLPPPLDECVVVPDDLVGPCVLGGEGECPPGYSSRDAFGAVQGCTPCTPGCSTADYCETVEVTPYSAPGCPAASALAPLTLDGACHTNFGATVMSVGFSSPSEPVCADVLATLLHTNVCCVP